MVFVFFNLVVSVYEFLATGGPNDLPPAIVEGFFLSIYTVYAATQLPVHTRAQYTA
jgi:hypothetical protein